MSEDVKNNIAVYVDDLVVGSTTFAQHIKHLDRLFRDVRLAGIKLNLGKTLFARKEVELVGHLISANGARPLENKLRDIMEVERPKTLKQLRKFIGFVSFYRKFIINFSTLLHPLNDLLKKDRKWQWKETHQKAFEEVKESFKNCVTLEHLNVNKPYTIRCDASGIVIAAILSQIDGEGHERIIAVTAEKRYSVTELELLSIVHATNKWRQYLIGNKVIVKSDHQALAFLNKGTGLNARLTRWTIALGEYDI